MNEKDRQLIREKLLKVTIEKEAVDEEDDVKLLKREHCNSITNLLQIFTKADDTVIELRILNETIYVYIKSSAIFKLTCSDVHDVEILENETACFKHFAIVVRRNNTSERAYIESEGILRSYSF